MDVEKLEVWQHSMELAAKVYEITDKFPKHEMYSLADQMRRAAVSIPSNIAEGKGRRTTKDFIHFLYVARGSLNELTTQIKLAKRIGYLTSEDYTDLISKAEIVRQKLGGFLNYLRNKRT